MAKKTDAFKTVKLGVTMPLTLKMSLDSHVPERKRSEYISNAVRNALKEDEKKAALEALSAVVPKKVSQSSVDIIRDLRDNYDAHIDSKIGG